MTEPVPKPPSHLSVEAKKWWKKLCSEYEGDLGDSASQILLETAFSAFDRWQSARKILAKEGMIVTDRHGSRVVHPAVRIERDSKATMISALRQLHLDLEPLNDRPGRPAGR